MEGEWFWFILAAPPRGGEVGLGVEAGTGGRSPKETRRIAAGLVLPQTRACFRPLPSEPEA